MSDMEKFAQAWNKRNDTTPVPTPPGPMPKTLSHFATVEEWEQHRKEVKEAQEQGAPF